MKHMTNYTEFEPSTYFSEFVPSPNSNLNDEVDLIHVQLWADEKYRKYLSGIDEASTVEGSFYIDDIEAAKMIREYARCRGSWVSLQNIASIVKALRVVKRRYSISRKERA